MDTAVRDEMETDSAACRDSLLQGRPSQRDGEACAVTSRHQMDVVPSKLASARYLPFRSHAHARIVRCSGTPPPPAQRE